jgi:gamma-glutamyltranspeptidase/glutathione hydrolase
VVAAAHHLATEAGATMLDGGGNAADAAIAISLALGVCEPAGSGLGGMAHAVVRFGEDVHTVEGPCRCPATATEEALASAPSRYRGYRAVAVPGACKVLAHLAGLAHLDASSWFTPAIRLAEEGVEVGATLAELLVQYRGALDTGSASALFGADMKQGDRFAQPELAATLRHLADAGFDDFYTGDVGARIARAMRDSGGFITERDLRTVPPARTAEPLRCRWRGNELFTLGPPGGGYTLVELCNMAEVLGLDHCNIDAPEGVVTIAKLIERARADRKRWARKMETEALGEGALLVEEAFARRAIAELGLGETSHFCVVDADGNAIAMTQSIERSFGAAEIAPDLGFVFNGFMRAFKVGWPSHPHAVEPGIAARSNAAPTIVMSADGPRAVVGATGSERAVSAIFCTLLRLAGGESPFAAAWGPRLHATPQGKVLLELDRHPEGTARALRAAGFDVEDVGPYAFKMGGLQLVAAVDGEQVAVADPRRDGAAKAAHA